MEIHRNVSNLPGGIPLAAIELPVQNNCRANARADDDQSHATRPSARPEVIFRQRRRLGIVLQLHWQAQLFAQHGRKRHVAPAGQIGGIVEDATLVIEGPRAANAHALDVYAWRRLRQ